MASPRLVKPDRFQLIAEKGLFYAAWALGVLHMLLTVFRYTVNYALFRPYIRWYFLLLIVAAVIYLLLYRVRYPRTMYRVKSLFKNMRNFGQAFMLALFFWFVLVCAVRQSVDHFRYFKFGDWWLLDTAVSAFILFPIACFAGRENAKKYVEWMLHIVTLAYTVFTAWALWHVFHLNVLTLPSGSQIGMTANSQLSLGCYYNISGAISFTMFAVSCYMIATQKTGLKVIYLLAAALHLLAALLSNSRTVYVTLLFFCSASVFFGIFSILKTKTKAFRILVSLAAAACCLLLLRWLRTAVFVMFDSITNFHALLNGPGDASVITSAEDDVRELKGLSGREAIWKGAFKIMISSPTAFFFGVTPFQVTDALKEIGGLTFDCAHAHNVVLQVGASMGVPMMVAFVVFLLKTIITGVKVFVRARGRELRDSGMAAILIASLMMMNLTEAYLVAYFSIMSSVFFLFCGYLYYLKPEPKL